MIPELVKDLMEPIMSPPSKATNDSTEPIKDLSGPTSDPRKPSFPVTPYLFKDSMWLICPREPTDNPIELAKATWSLGWFSGALVNSQSRISTFFRPEWCWWWRGVDGSREEEDVDGNRSPTTVRNTSPNSIAPRTQLQSHPVVFSFLFLLYYDYIKFFFSRLIPSLTWMIFFPDQCPFLSNWWRYQQLRSFCIVLVILFGSGKIWLPINFDIGARSTLNLQYHCRTLMDIWEHALYWCETLILMERGIDTPSLRLLQDTSTNTPLHWLRCIEGGQFRLGISETYWRKQDQMA